MLSFESIAALRSHLAQIRETGQSIGFVPTMGNLHKGHLALVKEAQEQSDYVVASIFVNPLQFGPEEDYERYPRTFDQDREALENARCDALFIPAVNEIYPQGLDSHTLVSVPELSELYCGSTRPGHFNGVATVVTKLFNIVQPDLAVFGLKDYQQLQVIRKLVRDLCLPVSIIGVETCRESDGLAISSRNAYLTVEQRRDAARIYRILQSTAETIAAGNRDFSELEQMAKSSLNEGDLKVDYFNICHAHTLLPATEYDTELVILAAAWLGSTRLIDNISIDID